jgi:hypothetical protein
MKTRSPRRRFIRILASPLIGLALFGLGAAPAWALDPNLPPGSNFDLSHWYLQLPTSNNILTGASGSVDSASATQLVAGFTNAYFYTGPDGAMTFWVPDNGARTSGSDHPRSEFREQLIPGNNNTNWTVYGVHTLTAQCKVVQVPSDTGKVCIGQMHEPNTRPDGSTSAGNEHMIMFDYNNRKIYVNINLDGDLSSSFSQTLISGSGVALNSNINYTISASNGLLTISVNNVTNSWDLFSGTNYQGHIAQNWDTASGNTLYFKAGDYNQTTNQCGCSTDGATVAFYSLTRYHAPSITSQPVSRVVSNATSATFTVGALGNGNFSYQWRFNATNTLAGVTNASFTIANVSGANAGSYTVMVTDSLGSVTSAVATLTVGGTVAFTTAGTTTWTCPAGVTAIQVECWGGGGAGGSAFRTPNSASVQYGGGGAGGAAATGTLVNDTKVPGADSWFNSVNSEPASAGNCVAKGGDGGQCAVGNTGTTAYGSGGVGTTNGSLGDVLYAGGGGGTLTSSTGYGGSGGGSGGTGSNGSSGGTNGIAAAAVTGGGPGGAPNATGGSSGPGQKPASGPGGGGGGARATAQQSGGNGYDGQVVLTYAVGACTAATAATPVGNGSGSGGLTTCASQPITLTETPSAGSGPFAYAWKKVGSGTVLGTSSTLLVAVPVDDDAYTCDVTATCGGGISISPAAALTVSGPGVTLDHTTQSVYRTMSVSVTATLSGSATGGTWTSTGTGTFSSTNALTTIYTPSAADAGTTATLTFITTQGGPCGVVTATDVVTFSQTVNPAKVAIIKADDFRVPNLAWTNFLQTSRGAAIKVSLGVIVRNIVGNAVTAQWMQTQQALGDAEFWDHGWDHTQWTNSGQTISEFEGSGLAYMQQHLADAQAGLSNALGRGAIAFGTPYNGFDTNTATAINATPALRLFFASSVTTAGTYLDPRVGVVKIISESDGTGKPNAAAFAAAYPGGPTGPVALQFHPANSAFDASRLVEYQNIVQHLLTNGYSILLPLEYVATLSAPPTAVTQPASMITPNGAMLKGSVNPNGAATSYYFQYGVTTNYGSYSVTNNLTAGTSPVAVNSILTGLFSDTPYHCQLVATNSAGSSAGTDQLFTTPALSSPDLSGLTVTFAGAFQFAFSSTPVASFTVLVSTNLTNWTVLGPATEGPSGQYQFSDPQAADDAQRFYRVRSP